MKSADDVIRAMEEIEEEDLAPIEFARKSAETFNKWAEENPGELNVLTEQHYDWMLAYQKRVRNRLHGIDWKDVFPESTTQAPEPPQEEP